ncbi:hypothetical protein, partial [Streptomyces sp. NPDC127112]|uniref:hypothetical protein n=1 Tax=Streptomyces sp. NPDC127112 TaxID=3345364 RepID=UPI003643A5C6
MRHHPRQATAVLATSRRVRRRRPAHHPGQATAARARPGTGVSGIAKSGTARPRPPPPGRASAGL